MIIDGHTHLFGDKPKAAEELLRAMDNCGVDKAVVSCLETLTDGVYKTNVLPSKEEIAQCNKDTFEAVRVHRDRIIGACYVNPKNSDCKDVIRRGVEAMDMRLIKLWLSCTCDDDAANDVAEMAIKYNIPILIHTFFMHRGNPPYESTGLHVRNLALRYPKVKLIMAHMGGNPYHGIRAVADLPNVYTDYAGTFYGHGDIKFAAKHLGEDRLIFGTDFPISNELFGIGKIESADISDEGKRKIYAENILRLLDTSYHIGDSTHDKVRADKPLDLDRIYALNMENIDVNMMFGSLPYFKTPYSSLDALERKRDKHTASAAVSSLDALFVQDSREADGAFVEAKCDTFVKKIVTINPTMPCALSDLHDYAGKISGVKIAPYLHGYSLCDERVMKLAEQCAALSLPLFVAGRIFDERQQYCIKSEGFKPDEAKQFVTGADSRLKIVLLSLRQNEIEDIAALGLKNVFFDTSGLKGGTFVIERLLEKVDASQLMHGTASPVYNEKSVLYLVSGAQIPLQTKRAILFDNAKRLLDM